MPNKYEQSGFGSIAKNDDKVKDGQPDYKGSCTIDGQKYWIAAWPKENENGKYLSLAFTKAEGRAPAAKSKPRTADIDF